MRNDNITDVDGIDSAHDASDLGDTFYLMVLLATDEEPFDDSEDQAVLPVHLARSRLDAAGRRIWADTERVERMLGWSEAELMSASIDRIHPDDHERSVRSFADLVSRPGGETRIRQRSLHKDGHWVWLEITHTNLLHTDDPHIAVESLDISEEMAVQVELQERESLLANLTEALPVGVLHLAADGTASITSSAWSRLTGANGERGLSALCAAIADPDALLAAANAATEEGRPVTIAIEFESSAATCSHGELEIRPDTAPSGHTSLLFMLTDLSDVIEHRENLERIIRRDHLTQVPNRLGLEEALDDALTAATESVTLPYLDVNEFRQINDGLGHAAGDAVLIEVAQAIEGALRSSDLVARIGGDEFAVLLVGATADETDAVLGRIHERVEAVSTTLDLEHP